MKTSFLLSLQRQNMSFLRRIFHVGFPSCENGRLSKLVTTGNFLNGISVFYHLKLYSVHIVNKKQQAFYTIIYLSQFVIAVVIALPS